MTHDLSGDAPLGEKLVAGTKFLLREIVLAAQQVKRRKRSGRGRGVRVRSQGSIIGRRRPLDAFIFLHEASVSVPESNEVLSGPSSGRGEVVWSPKPMIGMREGGEPCDETSRSRVESGNARSLLRCEP